MVTATAEVDLKLTDFHPRSMLVTAEHAVERPIVPAIDYHNHLDSCDPREVLTIMDACGIDRIVNITMQTGDAALTVLHRFHSAAPERFSTMGWMDWSGIEQPDFFRRSVDRLELLVEHGACGLKMWKDLGLTVRDASGQLLRIDDERLAPIFEKAAELEVPVMFHTADPDAFFFPSISTTSDMRSWRRTPIGVSTGPNTRSRSCWSNAIASSPATRKPPS